MARKFETTEAVVPVDDLPPAPPTSERSMPYYVPPIKVAPAVEFTVIDAEPMTVNRLIELLNEAVSRGCGDIRVSSEGCDCVDDAYGVEVFEAFGGRSQLMITRKR